MLVSITAPVGFTCHKEAIVTMGVFQPFNYLFFGKTCQAYHMIPTVLRSHRQHA